MHFPLPQFVQFSHYDHVELITELDRKLNPRGKPYPYRRSLRQAINSFIDGKSESAIADILERPTSDHERKYNQAAYSVFKDRFEKHRGTMEILDISENYPVPQFGINISVEPWFSTFEKGITHLHVVWAYNSPKLQQRNANIGNLVFEKAFSSSRYGNSQFCIIDLVTSKRFSNKTVTKKTEMAFESLCASLWRESQNL